MKRGTPNHPKVTDLARRLNIPRAHAVGLLEMLWHTGAAYARNGAIGAFSDDSIAESLTWPIEDSKRLIDALVESKWLDRHKRFRLVIHDWEQHVDDTVHAQLARGREFFANGSQPLFSKLSAEEKRDAQAFYENAQKHQQKGTNCGGQRRPTAANGGQRRPTADFGGQRPPALALALAITKPLDPPPSPSPPVESTHNDRPRLSDEGRGGVADASKAETRKASRKPATNGSAAVRPMTTAVPEEPEPWL